MSETRADTVGSVMLDRDQPEGYRRSPDLQDAFDQAKVELLDKDGWPDPQQNNQRRLMADLALEGGGVKGIGLVGAVMVLEEAGYSFRGVAGTSAGAIAASLIAALSKSNESMLKLKQFMGALEFSEFMPEGKLHAFLDHEGGKVGTFVADAAILSHKLGIYPGDYLHQWLGPILEGLDVRTFADLKLSQSDDPGMSLPPGHEYNLVVHTADITRAQLVRLPWDFEYYGLAPDSQNVVDAVRASMSIPFFFEPVTITAPATTVSVPRPDGGIITQHYEGGTVTWVDGGLLRNFPISAFDRDDGAPPRWPTIGIKLSALATSFPLTNACESALAVGVRCVRTMMNEWDSYSVEETTAGRTIFVNNAGLTATDFHLTRAQQDQLFLNGVHAATNFVMEMAKAGGVPRTPDAARDLIRQRRIQPGSTGS